MLAQLLKAFFSKDRPVPQTVDAGELMRRAESAVARADWGAAEQVAQQLAGLPGHEADAHHILAIAAYRRSDSERALAQVDSALALDSGAAHFHNTRGQILGSLGRFADATAAYESAMKLAPGFGAYVLNYANSRKFSAVDMPFIDAVEKQLAAASGTGEHRAHLQFALAKALNDCALYDRAFSHARDANAAKFASKPFAMEPFVERIEALKSVFDETILARREQFHGRDDIRPIFIVGMPRSGSTLLESLLCKEPGVVAGGELTAMGSVLKSISRTFSTSLPFPECLRGMTVQQARELARTYCDNLTPSIAAAPRFTDKHPYNFQNIGLAAMLFPQACFVHTKRHPLDVCLSSYLTYFAYAHAFTYDIETLCRYYGQYESLMAHWDRVLPGSVIHVQYRDLVETPEATIRTLRERLGLSAASGRADPLPTHAVRTASQWQVRQPVYKTSLNRWRNYRNHIAPFVAALRSAGVEVDLTSAIEDAAAPGGTRAYLGR